MNTESPAKLAGYSITHPEIVAGIKKQIREWLSSKSPYPDVAQLPLFVDEDSGRADYLRFHRHSIFIDGQNYDIAIDENGFVIFPD